MQSNNSSQPSRHTSLTKTVNAAGNSPEIFLTHAAHLDPRPYQLPPLSAIVDSVRRRLGRSFIVVFPRQSGKNEIQAVLISYLMFLFQNEGGDIVSVSPTYKPQTENAMRRLKHRLDKNVLTAGKYRKVGYTFRLGQAQTTFFSGDSTAKVVGNTASLLLSIDEAQDVTISKYDKDFEPMVASTNATRVFWGTRWTDSNLLERELSAALASERAEGLDQGLYK